MPDKQSGARNLVEAEMVLCPECESEIDVDEDELDEGELLSCTECGSEFEVVGVEPLELAPTADDDDDEDTDDEDEDDDA